MKNPKKPVDVLASKSVQKKLDDLKETDAQRYEFVMSILRDFRREYPITNKAELHPVNEDGTRNFVADSGYNVTFAGWAEELSDKHIVHIVKLFF